MQHRLARLIGWMGALGHEGAIANAGGEIERRARERRLVEALEIRYAAADPDGEVAAA